MPPRGVPTKKCLQPQIHLDQIFSLVVLIEASRGRLAGTPLVEDYDAKGLRTPQPRIVNDGMRWADGLQSLTVDPYMIGKSMLPQGHLHWLIYKVSRKDGRSMWSLCQNLSRPSGPLVINQTITKLQMTAAKNLSIAHYK